MPGTDLGAKGLEVQTVVANSKKVHDLGKPTMPPSVATAREMQKHTPLK